MKPFSLEEYLKNPFRKLITRDERKARIICTDAKGDFPIVALIEIPDGTIEFSHKFKKNGHLLDGDDHCLDLFFAPEKHEGWINVMGLKRGEMYCGFVHDSEEEARRNGGETAIATVKIEWEE